MKRLALAVAFVLALIPASASAQWVYPVAAPVYQPAPWVYPVTAPLPVAAPYYVVPQWNPYLPAIQYIPDPGARAWCSQSAFTSWACLRLG